MNMNLVGNVWFTSDWHFDHHNIIRYCNRPFDNIKQMNETILRNLNAKVGRTDTLFVLGDVSFARDKEDILDVLEKINCKNMHLIFGNHDKNIRKNASIKAYFASTHELLEFEYNNRLFVLCHYALAVWNKSHHKSIHLFGHSHGTYTPLKGSRSMDVGVDCLDFKPIHIDDVIRRMDTVQHMPVDHHGVHPAG